MKYDQLIFGLLAGAALGAFAVSNGHMGGGSAGGVDRAEVEKIVRDTIAKEPKLIIDSVQKYQQDMSKKSQQGASDALKDSALHDAIYNDPNSAFIGPKDSKKVVVEYFDYNCPACKMMYQGITNLTKQHPDVKIIFKEFPIFGPTSDANSKLGFAIWHLYPEKYFAFYGKMQSTPGHGDEKNPPKFVAELGMDMAKLQAYAAKPEVDEMLKATREQGDKLHIQGTPTLIVGDEVVPHALGYEELVKKLGFNDAAPAPTPEPEAAPAPEAPKAEAPAPAPAPVKPPIKHHKPKPAADAPGDSAPAEAKDGE